MGNIEWFIPKLNLKKFIMQGTAVVQVTIGDINDNSPQFNAPYYTASVRENSPAGTTIVPVNLQ